MNVAKLLHNPTAGEAASTALELRSLIESNGFECQYASTKDSGWETIGPEVDFLIVAGGDGTVRQVAQRQLTAPKRPEPLPIAILPKGTANNIALTLGLTGTSDEIVAGWHRGRIIQYQVGLIHGLAKPEFFLEGCGLGVFPKLINTMRDQEEAENETREESLLQALTTLHSLIGSHRAETCQLILDTANYADEFVLLEVLNSRLLGPNLCLAPAANPQDKAFEVVLVTEQERPRLSRYVDALRLGGLTGWGDRLSAISATQVKLSTQTDYLHIDDEVISLDGPTDITISFRAQGLPFLLPG
ncbi:hypothetical protein BN8_06422 [Fibrisoma limi BUZ 3]|uniref:DAGKc domain-containing protein n=2 Tax=Fibrisoma limi TaxID=663275 RepID=I2GSZ5_9BACT|nr:hypothetical protein BN8_06422 [Fibrisoma limi BUZ 3]